MTNARNWPAAAIRYSACSNSPRTRSPSTFTLRAGTSRTRLAVSSASWFTHKLSLWKNAMRTLIPYKMPAGEIIVPRSPRADMSSALLQSHVNGVPCRRGKVRDVYDLGDRLVIVATDRISAFDWVLPTPIPDKGRILTRMTMFWLEYLGVPNHLIST